MDLNLSKRLHSKSVKNAIINNISHDFNLTPILAEAYFNQIKTYFLEHADIELSAGQMQYLAVDDREPAGKPAAKRAPSTGRAPRGRYLNRSPLPTGVIRSGTGRAGSPTLKASKGTPR